MTQQGGILFRAASRILAEVTEMRHMLKKSSNKGLRQLRVGATSIFSTMVLPDIMGGFLKKHLDTKFNLVGSNELFDLKTGEVDILIWPINLKEKNLVTRPLKTYHYGLFASAEYLKEFGKPQSVEDLKNHRLLGYSPESVQIGLDHNWHLKLGLPDGKRHEVYNYASNSHALATLAEKAGGIASIAQEAAEVLKPHLVRVLPDVGGPSIDLNFIHLESLGNFPLIEELYESLKQQLNDASKERG